MSFCHKLDTSFCPMEIVRFKEKYIHALAIIYIFGTFNLTASLLIHVLEQSIVLSLQYENFGRKTKNILLTVQYENFGRMTKNNFTIRTV